MVVIDTFKKMLKLDQAGLKKTMTEFLTANKYKPIVGDGFVYAKGDIPIMLVAHLDTVHKSVPRDIYYDEKQDVMWSPQGIGGDDRCGVYIITKLIEEFRPYVLFTEDEEIGGVGAKKVVETIIAPDVKFIIEIDRRGSNDCVFYDCDNKDFTKYIESFGFKTAIGTFSDICTLSDHWEVASVNLSSGYYNEHTSNEIIKLEDMEKTYDRVKKILGDKNSEYYEFIKKEYNKKYPITNSGDNTKNHGKDIFYQNAQGYVGADGCWHWWDEEYDDYDYIR